jgi:FixJ family two-component response regulator
VLSGWPLNVTRTSERRKCASSRFKKRFDQLSSREREVLDSVVAGVSNRQIAYQLAIGERTVKARALSKSWAFGQFPLYFGSSNSYRAQSFMRA